MGRLSKVLVIDDNPFTGLLTQRKIEEMGRPVVAASELDEALEMLDDDPPSIVILAGPLTLLLLAAIGARPHLESLVRVCLVEESEDPAPYYSEGADMVLNHPIQDEDWKHLLRSTF